MFDSGVATSSRPIDAVTGDALAVAPVGTALEEVPLDELMDDLRTWAGHIAAAEAHWMALVGEFCRRDGHRGWGLASPAHWLAWQCSLSPGTAREHVRVALALLELPVTRAHFAAGRISFSKVRAMTRVADADNERALVRLALNGTASQLERTVSEWAKAINRDDPDRAATRHERRGVTTRINDHGNGVITIETAPENLRRAMDGIDAWLDHIDPGPFDNTNPDHGPTGEGSRPVEPAERATLAQRRADAFMALIDDRTGVRHGADRVRASLDVDLRVLSQDADGTCQVRNGPTLAAETARRLTCDAELEIFHSPASPDPASGAATAGDADVACNCGGHDTGPDDEPIQLMEAEFITDDMAQALAKTIADPVPVPEASRVVRTINRATRRAVARRDKGCCQFPGCTNTLFTQIHHIIHWACGGDHALTNLTTLCSAHHRLVHEGGYRIAGDGNHPVFLRPDDSPMTVAPIAGERGVVEHLGTQLELTPATLSRGCGDRLNLDYAVSVYAQNYPDTKVRSRVPAGTPRTRTTDCTRRPEAGAEPDSGPPPHA